MANPEHLKILKQGVEAWNKWRKDTKLDHPDLSGADLHDADFPGIALSGANLHSADLSGTDLSGADLRDAKLGRVWLFMARLCGANLGGANLARANFNGADLSDADLSGVHAGGAILRRTNLANASLADAFLSETIFAFTSLKTSKGLESCNHIGPSVLDYHTLMASGPLPEVFLRGCGLSDEFIGYMQSVWNKPIQFASCFISYSTQDEEFASRLHNDFQGNGIRCWKWDHDARTGRSLWGEIDQAIRHYGKLVLIASKSSLISPAVNREIERALVQEDERLKRKFAGDPDVDSDVLIPVSLDDFLVHGWEHERKVDVTKKVIADARGWDKDAAVYARVRDRLIHDLKSKGPPN